MDDYVTSITKFLLSLPPDTDVIDTYNQWSSKNSIVLKNSQDVQWFLTYIKNFKNVNREIMSQIIEIEKNINVEE